MTTESIDKARQIDFERLHKLVVERITALKCLVDNIDTDNDDPATWDAICRDLVFPCVHTLADFIESVNITEKAA